MDAKEDLNSDEEWVDELEPNHFLTHYPKSRKCIISVCKRGLMDITIADAPIKARAFRELGTLRNLRVRVSE